VVAVMLVAFAEFTSSGLWSLLARSFATMCAAQLLATAVHEFSHAAIARGYGFTVDHIRIGVGGAVEWYPASSQAPTRQLRNVVAAGPASHLPLVLVGLVGLGLVPWTSAWFLPLCAFTGLNLALAVQNFFPTTIGKDDWPWLGGFNGHPTDGMIIRRLGHLRADGGSL